MGIFIEQTDTYIFIMGQPLIWLHILNFKFEVNNNDHLENIVFVSFQIKVFGNQLVFPMKRFQEC